LARRPGVRVSLIVYARGTRYYAKSGLYSFVRERRGCGRRDGVGIGEGPWDTLLFSQPICNARGMSNGRINS
jgi:hypothetical protein